LRGASRGRISLVVLTAFIDANREGLIERARAKVAKRLSPRASEGELAQVVPLFLDQLVERLAARPAPSQLSLGYSVAQVVHTYGDVSEAITDLAVRLGSPISRDEFDLLRRCLDDAIAEAVTEYSRLRDQSMAAGETERSGVFAHELRNKLSAAQMGFLSIKSGQSPVGGAVSALVERSLHGMTALINRALVDVRLESGSTQQQRVHLQQLLDEAAVDGRLAANVYGVSLSVKPLEHAVDVHVDPEILTGALANVLLNAFKFSRKEGHVSLQASVHAGRIEIDVEDECGGLPPGKAEELFGAFQQRSANRSGLGLGLFVSRKAVEASGGLIRVRDIPGSGCVFTIDLPLMPLAA
jgi:signal transduction histidine kinase